MNRIVIDSVTYENDVVYDGNVLLVESLTGDELQYDSINVTVSCDGTAVFMTFGTAPTVTDDGTGNVTVIDATTSYDDNGNLTILSGTSSGRLITADDKLFTTESSASWNYGDPLYYYHNDNLIGKFYVESVKRVGKTAYNIQGVSGVGLLANTQHYGGIYFGIKMADLVDEIIGDKIKYSIDPMIANQPLYGWLPIATRRENLHQVLFAMSASVKKDEEGEIFITALSKDTATDLPDSRIYEGGSIEYPQAFTKVALSEHAYIERADDESVTLYDGEISADNITTPTGAVVQGGLILFDVPAHDLTATGTTIIESGVNYAVLSPSAECQLVGQKYTHTVRQVTRPETQTEGDEATENKIVVSDATLVSVANSENVAERLSDYYDTAKVVTVDIVVDEERAGDAVTFNDPFDELATGIISSMEMSMSNILKAKAEIITDYAPPSAGNYYNNVAVITDDGTWKVPEGVEKIRVVLIGGGQGGWSGYRGENGKEQYKGGAGGEVGAGGAGGKIYITTVAVDSNVFRITIGTGGAGGVCTGVGTYEGEKGTATTFGEYSSEDGTTSSIGFTEIFEGMSYGTTGLEGEVKGADGGGAGKGGGITYDGITYIGGAKCEDSVREGKEQTIYQYGGGGGGAAACAKGGDGEGENGGKGANATIAGANAIIAGAGGQGGNGGGGGGGGGYEKSVYTGTGDGTGLNWTWAGDGGAGGLGSNGGKGADGCVIIYY